MVRQFKVIVEKHSDGYVAYPFGLKGAVVGEGDTYEEALINIREAIIGWLEVAQEFGDPIPASDVLTETLIEVPA